jgi:hypothetical protein
MNRPAFIKPLLIIIVLLILGIGTYVSMSNGSDKNDLPGQAQMEENLTAISLLQKEGNESDDAVYCRTLNRRLDAAKDGFSQMLSGLNALSSRKYDAKLGEVKMQIDEACS